MYVLQSLIVLILVAVCGYFSSTALLGITAMVRSGAEENLFGDIKKRIDAVIDYVFFHKKVLDDKSYGFFHMIYFYGFIILAVGHLELVFYGLTKFLLQFDVQPFLYRNFLPAWIIKPFELSQDLMAFFVLIAVSIALPRRIFFPKKRLLPRSRDAELILWLIGSLYVSFFIFIPSEVVYRIQSGELTSGFLWYMPLSSLIAQAYELLPGGALSVLHQFGFWTHISIFLGFAVYIPNSKHLHLIAAGPNIYFRHFDSVAKPLPIDFDTAEEFGVDRVDKLSWKSLLDTFACTECGRCDAVCPAALTKKSLHPKKVLHDIKMNLRYENWDQFKKFKNFKGDTIKGKEQEFAAIELKTPLIAREKIDGENPLRLNDGSYDIHGQIHLDDIWGCTTCAACVDACPVLIDSVPTSLINLRRHLVMMEANDYPKELNAAMKGMEMQSNPWGVGQDKRTDWAMSLDVPVMADRPDAEVEYLFWVGCAGSTDDRAKKIQQALVRILKSAKVDFAILGCEEKCTGDPARRMGNEYLFDMLAKENIATLSKYKFKKIFTSCPHCFNSLKNEYKDFGTNYSVQHHSELINELLKDGRIPLVTKEKFDKEVTFHDPCYLGRYNESYDAPRSVINSVAKNTKEMSMNKRNSFCCGAGGGRMFMEEHQGVRINHERTEQAIATGAKIIATGCPFCMTMMSDGIKDKGCEEDIVVKDIAELVAERL
ncbi:MAG: (Fe-S)-binding protein [Myxococcales bacterium]|nr:(Fe-S)-binding protein [Myxococcales bacterium]USN51317.1 MAG: (Fe-S)-binding protein [Myxococcales bacterium]